MFIHSLVPPGAPLCSLGDLEPQLVSPDGVETELGTDISTPLEVRVESERESQGWGRGSERG